MPEAPNNGLNRGGGRISQRNTSQCLGELATSWNTPQTSDTNGQREKDGKRAVGLNTQAGQWPTPRNNTGPSTDGKHRTLCGVTPNWPTPRAEERQQHNSQDAGQSLGKFTTEQVEMWATPRTCAGTRSSGANRTELVNAWATPRSSASENRTTRNAPTHGKTHGLVLAGQAGQWQTPRSHEVGDYQDQVDGSETATLTGQAKQWPTPAARDVKSTNGAEHLENGTGRKHLDQLPNFVKFLFSRPAPESASAGQESSAPRRTLNPLFVEWLMNWPIGWTGSACAATEYSRWLRQSRSRFWQIVP